MPAKTTPLDDLKKRTPMQWLRERDIDLLICSELHSGGTLRDIFLGEWQKEMNQFEGAWVSHHDVDGESDIVAAFKDEERVLILLIEDKIDADFQPEQPQRYRARAQRWKAALPAGSAVETVLLAPDGYSEHAGSELFDRIVSYEDIVAALGGSGDPRTRFLGEILQNGIESHRHGYAQNPSEATTNVWTAIWDMVRAEAPQLRMERPYNKSLRAGFVSLANAVGVTTADTRRRAKIRYKAVHGNVDIEFASMRAEVLQEAVEHLLEEGMSIVQASKSASIRIRAPAVDFGQPSNQQEEAIRQGVLAAERLRLFFIENRLTDLVP